VGKQTSCGLENARRLVELVGAVGRTLSEAGIDTARLDARLLIAHATSRASDDVVLQPDAVASPEALRILDDLVERRVAREPMSQILGIRGFYDLEFKVTSDVLTPRPETETLVEAVLDATDGRSQDALSLLDLGTGSGCLLLSLVHALPTARGLGTDLSEAALAVAKENARIASVADRVRFSQGSWFDAVDTDAGPFDVIVSNPPYIPSRDVEGLDPEVRDHEPRLALDGGGDGLGAYRVIAGGARERLSGGGLLAVEIGIGQAVEVVRLFETSGFTDIAVRPDLSGIERAVLGRAP